MKYKLSELNQMSQEAFVDALGWVFEDSPWVAQKTWMKRPFANVTSLHQTMIKVVQEASLDQQLALIRAHPDLATKVKMSASSVQEQAAAGLDQLTSEECDRFHFLNQAYKDKFDFPFIIAVKNHTKESILKAFDTRLKNTLDEELKLSLSEIAQIAWFRLLEIRIT